MKNPLLSFVRQLSDDRDRFALWLPVLLGAGVGLYFCLPFEPNIWVLCGVLAILCVVLRLCWGRWLPRLAVIALLLVTSGVLRAELRSLEIDAPILHNQLFFRPVEGKIIDIQIKEKGEKLVLSDVSIDRVQQKYTPLRVSVSLRNVADGLAVGDRVRLYAMLFPPPTPTMPGSYDFARMFFYQQLGAVGYSPKEPEVLEKVDPNNFEQRLNAFRLRITDRILAPMTYENGWISAAMMTGEMSGVGTDTANAMRNSGIYHVLSISGLHMSLAVMLVFVSVRFLLCLYPPFALRYNVKKIAAAIGLISSFAYLMLAGYPVPAVRSFIMVACVMVAILCDRRGISIYSIAWSATIILLWQPESLLGASFQLSYAATLGILAFFETCQHLLHKPNAGFFTKFWLYFWGIALTSLIATLATTPLVLYHFNRFTVWGIAANMLMIPLASFWIMPAAVIAFLAMPFGFEHWPLVALNSGVGWMMVGARFFAGLSYASIALPPPSFWGIVLAVLGGLWLCLWRQNIRFLGIPAVLIGMATLFFYTPYDMLISDDGTKVAMRMEDGRFLFLRGRDSNFDAQMWLRTHGQDSGVTLSDDDGAHASCDRQKCSLRLGAYTIAVGKGKKTDELCEGKPDIVISSEYLDRVPECANIPHLFDKKYLRENGSLGLRFTGGALQVNTSESQRGERPWVAKPYSALSKTNNAVMMPPDGDEDHQENSNDGDAQ